MVTKGVNDWATSLPGTANNSGCVFNNVAPANVIPVGLTYTWTPASCISPGGLTATNITVTSADLSWNAVVPTPANGYQWEVRSSGAPGSGPSGLEGGGTTTGTTATTSLSQPAGTTYTLYVRSDCGGTYSGWASITFNSPGPCLSAPYGLWPTTTFNPSCTGSPEVITTVGYAGEYSNVNLSAGIAYTFTSSIATDWITISDATGTVGLAFGQTPVTYTPTTSGVHRFYTHTGSNCGSITTLRTRAVTCTPPCGTVTGITVTSITLNSLSFSWNAPPTPPSNGYQWEVRTSGAPGSGPTGLAASGSVGPGVTNATTGPVLTPQTNYSIYVRSDCGGVYGAWAGPVSAFTGHCIPTYTFGKTFGDLISNVEILGTTLSNNTGMAQVNPAYTYFNSQPYHTASLAAGTSYTVQISVGTWGDQHVRVWIDYNDNLVFEPSESVGSAVIAPGQGNTGPFPPATFTISLSCNPPVGVHRMRIRSAWSTVPNFHTTLDPCINYGYGETEDYDITVLPPPPCPSPIGLTFVSNTPTSATVTWTPGCNETAWDVLVQNVGDPAPTGSTPPTTTAHPSTTYTATISGPREIWVRANCGGLNGVSAWIGPLVVHPAPANDDCAGAIAFPAIPTNGNCATVNVNTQFANGIPDPSCTGTEDDDVWFTFTVPAGFTTINYSSTNISGSTDRAYQVFDACGGTSVFCSDAESGSITGLTSGATYWLRVYTWGSGVSTNMNLCLSVPPLPPANDNCVGATPLVPCSAPVNSGVVTGATQSLPANTCSGFTGNANDDVWFSFVATDPTMYITVAGYGGYDAVVEGREGPSCNGTFLGCVDATFSNGVENAVLTGATVGQTYFIRVYDYGSLAPAQTAGFTITVAPPGCWLGTVNTNWNTPGNWASGTVPSTCADNVIIPSGLTNYPVVNVPSATAGDVNIHTGASLTINAGNTLNVCGNMTNNGVPSVGNGTLNFNGTGNQTIYGVVQAAIARVDKTSGTLTVNNGSVLNIVNALQLVNGNFNNTSGGVVRLLSNGPNHAAIIDNFSAGFSGTFTGPVAAQRYISGTGNVQHQMGLPVSANLSQIGAGTSSGYVIPKPNCDETELHYSSPYGNVFRWDENNPTTCILQGWRVMNGSSPSETGRGYSTYQNGGSTIEVTGTPNLAPSYTKSNLGNSNYYLPTLQSTISYSFVSGWHLLSNPYPSGYTHTAQAGLNAVASVYVPSGPYSGTYQPLNPGDVLAPFQGFMIRNPNPGTFASYTFSSANRVASGNQTFYQQSYPEALEIEVSGNGFKDKTELRFNALATHQHDIEFDLHKQRSNLGQPTLFTGTGNDKFRIDVRPFTSSVPLGLLPGANGTFTFEVKGIQSFDPTTYIYLEDKVTGVWHNLRANNTYTFNMNMQESVDRFVLHFTPKAEITTLDASCTDNGQLSIIQPGPANWNYSVYGDAGTLVGSGILNETNPVTLSLPKGIYTLTLTDATGYQVVKNVTINGGAPVIASFQSDKQTAEVNEAITFTNTTPNATVINWNLGDGNISNQPTVSHAYAAEGVYTVTLNVTNADGCHDMEQKTVNIHARSVTGIQNQSLSAIRLYPNPNSTEFLTVELLNAEQATVRITNAIGEVVYTNNHLNKGKNLLQIGDLPAGVYMAEVNSGKLRKTERLVIVK
ncbi:MAG: PKD domain-containing protein [Chitinophagales bacterium]|nr:PKD domain-containing protein [Chitinophagales bacterium]